MPVWALTTARHNDTVPAVVTAAQRLPSRPGGDGGLRRDGSRMLPPQRSPRRDHSLPQGALTTIQPRKVPYYSTRSAAVHEADAAGRRMVRITTFGLSAISRSSFALSTSLKTSVAIRNASRQAGMPQ